MALITNPGRSLDLTSDLRNLALNSRGYGTSVVLNTKAIQSTSAIQVSQLATKGYGTTTALKSKTPSQIGITAPRINMATKNYGTTTGLRPKSSMNYGKAGPITSGFYWK